MDKALNILAEFIDNNTLVLADEHWSEEQYLSAKAVISNRFITSPQHPQFQFNDFEYQPNTLFDRVVFRLSKERKIVYRCIELAAQQLNIGGQLIFCGGNKEGIKTAIKHAEKVFNKKADISIDSGFRLCQITKTAELNVDDSDYSTVQHVQHKSGFEFWTKPGQFGWNKIDRGSMILAKHFEQKLSGHVLDLGCGWGYLSLKAAEQAAVSSLVSTDNNAAALLSIQKNVQSLTIEHEVIASDAGNLITEKFDHILCNPPFHSGFQHNTELTVRFINNTRRLLKNGGTAWWVVNQFIGVQMLAKNKFQQCTHVAREDGFDVWLLKG